MHGIIDHRKDLSAALPPSEAYIVSKNGQKRQQKTTAGWVLLVKWKDGKESWISLTHMKECHPLELVEYAWAQGIDQEPAFAWWVPFTLRKQEVI